MTKPVFSFLFLDPINTLHTVFLFIKIHNHCTPLLRMPDELEEDIDDVFRPFFLTMSDLARGRRTPPTPWPWPFSEGREITFRRKSKSPLPSDGDDR